MYGLLINFFLHYLQISEKGSSNLKLSVHVALYCNDLFNWRMN